MTQPAAARTSSAAALSPLAMISLTEFSRLVSQPGTARSSSLSACDRDFLSASPSETQILSCIFETWRERKAIGGIEFLRVVSAGFRFL